MLRSQDLAATVRTPINASEAKKVLAHLRAWDGKVSSKWKVRATAHQKAMERGTALDYADVYKELSTLEKSGALRASDRAHFNQSLEFLVEELANALGKTPDQARKQIVGG